MNWPLINTILLAILTIGSVGAVFATGFRSKSVRDLNEVLKGELTARKEQNDRLEDERDEYREKLHAEQNNHGGTLGKLHLAEIEIAELKVRTDFTPVLEFNKKWYAEQAEVSKQTLQILVRVAGVLDKIESKNT